MTRYLVLRESLVVPFSSEDELRMLVRRQNPKAQYLHLVDPISAVRRGFARDLVDLIDKYPELVVMFREGHTVATINNGDGWEFSPRSESPTIENWAEEVLEGHIITHESALDLIRRVPKDKVALRLAAHLGMASHRDPVQMVDPIRCRECGALAFDYGDGLCNGCRGRV